MEFMVAAPIAVTASVTTFMMVVGPSYPLPRCCANGGTAPGRGWIAPVFPVTTIGRVWGTESYMAPSRQ